MATVVLQYWAPSALFKRKILYLKEDIPYRIGRCHKNEFATTHNALFETSFPHISHHHAFFMFSEDKFYLQDSSINGTLVNGKLIEKLTIHQIFSEDIIQLGVDCYFNGIFQCFCFKIILTLGDNNFKYSKLLDEEYPCPLHLYTKPPTAEDMSLSLLYDKTLERFEVLQIFDNYGEIDLNKFTGIKNIIDQIREKGFINIHNYITRKLTSIEDEYNSHHLDNITHYILCIGCSKNSFLQKWFIKQETKLLYIKWKYLNKLEKMDILTAYNVPYMKIDIQEKQELVKHYPCFIDQTSDFLKIHFSKVSKVIHSKEYLLINGFAYVPLDILIVAIINLFREKMEAKLTFINKNLSKIWYEKRIISVIKYIENKLLPSCNYSIGMKTIVKRDMVDKLAEESFPLCMNILNYYLNKNHHLRNGGRFQYGLFLKGIGMPLSESLIFWRNHFTKIMHISHFEKHYSYHVRHLFGAVGKMFSYPPHDCNTILKVMPGPLEYHGCPFKLLDKENIIFELKRNQISDSDGEQIWEIMKNGFPQLACVKYFNIHHNSSENIITHPNLYFEKSQELLLAGRGKKSYSSSKRLNSCVACTNKQLEW